MTVLNYAASPLAPRQHGPQLDNEWWTSSEACVGNVPPAASTHLKCFRSQDKAAARETGYPAWHLGLDWVSTGTIAEKSWKRPLGTGEIEDQVTAVVEAFVCNLRGGSMGRQLP